MIGTVEITIRVMFNDEVTKQEARQFIDEMDYELKDTTGKVTILDTEVVSDDLDDRQFDDDETLAKSLEEEVNRKDIQRGLYGPEYKGEKF